MRRRYFYVGITRHQRTDICQQEHEAERFTKVPKSLSEGKLKNVVTMSIQVSGFHVPMKIDF